jgi:hypothetical protein
MPLYAPVVGQYSVRKWGNPRKLTSQDLDRERFFVAVIRLAHRSPSREIVSHIALHATFLAIML